MMNAFKHTPSIWEYLEKSGVLENGTEEQIKTAKKVYRQQYMLKYKQWQRANKPEFTIYFSNEQGEFSRLKKAATEHKMKIPGFLKAAALAYIGKSYLVPDREQIVRLELILGQIGNEIRSLCSRKTLWANPEERFKKLQARIGAIENEIYDTLRNPLPLEELIKMEVMKNPELRAKIISDLTENNDCQNITNQKTNLLQTA